MSLVAATDWKRDAAGIVEELFHVTSREDWDLLLDLRQALLAGEDWGRALDLFLHCRVRLESDHYLPFYRLRRLITASLRLEATSSGLQPSSLAELLKDRHRSLADLKRRVRREWFEHSEGPGGHISLRVVEA